MALELVELGLAHQPPDLGFGAFLVLGALIQLVVVFLASRAGQALVAIAADGGCRLPDAAAPVTGVRRRNRQTAHRVPASALRRLTASRAPPDRRLLEVPFPTTLVPAG